MYKTSFLFQCPCVLQIGNTPGSHGAVTKVVVNNEILAKDGGSLRRGALVLAACNYRTAFVILYGFLRICENVTKNNDIACCVEAYRELQWSGRSPALRHGLESGATVNGLAAKVLCATTFTCVRVSQSDDGRAAADAAVEMKVIVREILRSGR